MKKYLFILILLAGLFPDAQAQKELLAQNPAQDSIPRKFGPNLKYYLHFYVGYGLVANGAEGSGSKIRYGASHEWLVGVRFKYKLGEINALGMDVYVNPQTYYLRQKPGKTLPNEVLNDKEKLKFTNLDLAAYTRINYDKRGNYMGNFIDLGAYGSYTPIANRIYKNKSVSPLTGADNVKVRESNLKYVSDFNYGLLARAGFNRYVFYANYRLSDLFDTGYTANENGITKTYDFAELPRLTVGFQLSMHK